MNLLLPLFLLAATSTLPVGTPFIQFVSNDAITSAPVSRETIETAIDFYAMVYGVSSSTMRKIVKNESGFNQYAHNNNPKTRDDSYGLVQINKFKGGHADISITQAYSPFFAINFLASNLADGNCQIWTTCPYGSSAP